MTGDSFEWRSGGMKIDIGSETSAFIEVEGKFFCLTRKNITSILLADTIDPKRTNPNIRHSQQQILPYGSENYLVGRTLQQASVLFKDGVLPNDIAYKKGVDISFSFLNEIISLDEKKNLYLKEENNINLGIKTTPALDGSFHLPSIPNIDQKIYQFILNADHASACIMKLVQLFYPDIGNAGWEEKLYQKLKTQLGENDDATLFVKKFKDFTERIRNMRNAIEHKHNPKNKDKVESSNYQLSPENILEKPSLSFTGENTLPKIQVSDFMASSVENLLTIFESMMAYFCDINGKPFAGDKRVVVEIPVEKRQHNEKHVKFQYQVLWTK